MIGEAKEETNLKIRIPTPKAEIEEDEEKSKIKKVSLITYLFSCYWIYKF